MNVVAVTQLRKKYLELNSEATEKLEILQRAEKDGLPSQVLRQMEKNFLEAYNMERGAYELIRIAEDHSEQVFSND